MHKLLLDLLNAALRQEAVRLHTSRAPRCSGATNDELPRGGWQTLPDHEEALQRMVDKAMNQTLAWLMQASHPEEMPIEVQLSCLLDQDAADIEVGWRAVAAQKEAVLAHSADTILGGLVSEYVAELVGDSKHSSAPEEMEIQ